MDPTATYTAMFNAMADRDYDAAREHATALVEWFDKGGFAPENHSKSGAMNYALSVLERTTSTIKCACEL